MVVSTSGDFWPFLEEGDDAFLASEYLHHFNYEEYVWANSFKTAFIDDLIHAQFLPMSLYAPELEGFVLTPKLHDLRSVLRPEDVHITKTALRNSKRFSLKIDADFHEILQNILLHHGADWLTEPLVKAFSEMHKHRASYKTKFTSFSLYEKDTLVAGEFGYLSGSVYTSLSGYTHVSGAGTVQLVALSAFLHKAGVEIWDLGMDLPYKSDLGAQTLLRSEYRDLFFRSYAKTSSPSVFSFTDMSFPADELLRKLQSQKD